MAEEQEQAAADAVTDADADGGEQSLLQQAIAATKQTEPEHAESLLKELTELALSGTVTFDKNLAKTINTAIASIDEAMSTQLAAVMHHPRFGELEGTWRGLHYLVMNSETSTMLKIKMLNAPKKEMFKDLDRATEFDQSALYKKIYEGEFGTPGGEPFGALIGDYQFRNHPEDIAMLTKVSEVAAAAFCPFLSAADPSLMGLDNWNELSAPRDLAKIFDTVEYAQWKSYRDSEDSRFVTLSMPRALARLPYGDATKPVEEFEYEESPAIGGKPQALEHEEYCWMNAAYVLGGRMTDAFAQHGWCTAIRGVEGGGKVEGLPAHIFTSDDGDPDLKCPTEIGITDRREKELSDLGFLPLCHFKNTDYAVFFGAQTTQKPKKYDRPDATANAAISARLPYMMATARFSHYLKVIGRDKIGSFMEASDCQKWLNRWINNYVSGNPDIGPELKAKFPLAEARIEVKEVPGAPGSYEAIAWMRPWLQMEELTTSMRMVASIPKMG